MRQHAGLAVTASALQLPWSRGCKRPLILRGRKGEELSGGPSPTFPCMTMLSWSWDFC